jgi:hypothetical protein
MRDRPTAFGADNLENAAHSPDAGVERRRAPEFQGQEEGAHMIDSEVARLRKLRNVALRARALAKFLDSDTSIAQSVYAKSAVTCWTIARVATGSLRAHPFLSYQQDPSRLRMVADEMLAALVSFSAQRRQQSQQVFAQELQSVVREVDDARALTRSPDLSDALGRMQAQLRRLMQELGAAARVTTASSATRTAGETLAGEANWPYLAI